MVSNDASRTIFDLNTIYIAVVISLIIGAGAGYMVGNSPVSSLMEEKDGLEAEYDSLYLQLQSVESELDSTQELLFEEQRENNLLQERYMEMLVIDQENQVLTQQVIDLEDQIEIQLRAREVNVTSLAIDLMAKRSNHSWEESYYNPDIQGLFVIMEVNSWAHGIYEGLREEFQKRGGGVIGSVSLYPDSPDLRIRTSTEFSLANTQGQEFIETYGIDHVAILYIGGSYSYFLSKPEAGTPIFDKLTLIAIIPGADRQFLILENPPWA